MDLPVRHRDKIGVVQRTPLVALDQPRADRDPVPLRETGHGLN
jgi:hypothetical protein